MKFYTQTHQHYCGIDLHARCLYVCILDQQGNILVHKNINANPQALMKLVTPYLDDLVIGVAKGPGRRPLTPNWLVPG